MEKKCSVPNCEFRIAHLKLYVIPNISIQNDAKHETRQRQIKRRSDWIANMGCTDNNSVMYICECHFVNRNAFFNTFNTFYIQ